MASPAPGLPPSLRRCLAASLSGDGVTLRRCQWLPRAQPVAHARARARITRGASWPQVGQVVRAAESDRDGMVDGRRVGAAAVAGVAVPVERGLAQPTPPWRPGPVMAHGASVPVESLTCDDTRPPPRPCKHFSLGFAGGTCAYDGLMVSVSLSTRVAPELRQQLLAEARARRVALSTLARDLLAAGVDGSTPGGGDDAVQNEVRCIFAHLPPEAGLRREICLSLARTVESGGSAGIAAGRELLIEVSTVQRLYEPEDDWDEDLDGDDDG